MRAGADSPGNLADRDGLTRGFQAAQNEFAAVDAAGHLHSQSAGLSGVFPAAQAAGHRLPEVRQLDRLGFSLLPEMRRCPHPELPTLRPLDQPRLRLLPVLRESGGGPSSGFLVRRDSQWSQKKAGYSFGAQ